MEDSSSTKTKLCELCIFIDDKKYTWSNDNFIAFSNDDLRFLNNLFAKHKYDYNVILSDKINIPNNSYILQ